MKIIFICGTIEPGKDGVGDYTRRLAGMLAILGHSVSIISLYDTYISEVQSKIQHTDHSTILTHRLPFQLEERNRFTQVQKIINDIDPDWVSLQFVIFSFHPKGLPLNLSKKLKNILTNRKVHLMFHELWVGMDQESPLKLKVLGGIQKFIINNFIKRLKPLVIHTHTPLYQWQLSKIGHHAQILPLFGNIPVKEVSKKEEISHRFVVFGSIHFGAPVEAFAKELQSLDQQNDSIREVVFVGRCGNEQITWEQAFEAAGITCISLGEQTVDQISELLSGASYGITSTPYLLTEKSGTVAAMLEHGLQVLCVAREWSVESFNSIEKETISAIFKYRQGFLHRILEPNSIKKRSLVEITDQFIRSLK